MTTRRDSLFCLLAIALFVTACSTHNKHLSDAERAHLRDASAIHVFYYDTQLPVLRSAEKNPPTPAAIRKLLATDPAAQIAGQFTRLLARQEKLRNVQNAQFLSRPVARDTGEFRSRLQDGLVLEVWVDDWQFGPAPSDPKSYNMSLTAQARLTRLKDGRSLWRAKGCRLTSGPRSPRLANADLVQAQRLRKALTSARDDCAYQLMRDFAQRPG